MKKLLMAVAILTTVFIVESCQPGAGAGGDPKNTLLAFFDALGKKDIEGAKKLATTDSKSMLDMIQMAMNSAKESPGDDMDKFDKMRMEFGDATIQGDKATVPVKDKKSGEMTSFTLKKESGAWKVAFDKSTMMEMGMNKMKEKNPAALDSLKSHLGDLKNGSLDSLSKHLDEIKNINTDSLREIMNNGMKSLDSIKQILKDKKQ